MSASLCDLPKSDPPNKVFVDNFISHLNAQKVGFHGVLKCSAKKVAPHQRLAKKVPLKPPLPVNNGHSLKKAFI